jgi:hypothetical protein
MIEEATTGVAPSFNPYPGIDPFPSKSEKFQSWAKLYAMNEVLREVLVLGNYANTNMLRAYLDDREFIIPGANMYSEWNNRDIGVSDLPAHSSFAFNQTFQTNSLMILSCFIYCIKAFHLLYRIGKRGIQIPCCPCSMTSTNLSPRSSSCYPITLPFLPTPLHRRRFGSSTEDRDPIIKTSVPHQYQPIGS